MKSKTVRPGVQVMDGAQLREALASAARWVEQHAEALNALNVFPVPDGDTGLNMSLTLRSAVDEAQAVASSALKDVAPAMAHGAIMGARGNSGVILAGILRGMARVLAESEGADAGAVAVALTVGSAAAYGAVPNPVEGTILTVARAAAEAAQEAARQTGDLVAILDSAHRRARAAVAETPELLPILKQASVVDAGGEGYRIFLEGLLMYLRGDRIPEGPAAVTAWADLSSLHQDEEDFYGYCTEVLFQGADLDVVAVRERVSALGTSVLVVGDSQLLKVHVHTLRPGAVLDLATEVGELVKVKIDNMQLQHGEFARAASAARPAQRERGTGVVAVASGKGLEEVFSSLGALVVRGGQTMNPAVEEILTAIEQVPWEQVIVLPNNQNVVLAAQQAAQLARDRIVRVIPTRNVAQGVAAALALNPEADADTNRPALEKAADRCHCIEITRAVRNAQLEGLEIPEGALLALLDGRPIASAGAPDDLLGSALEHVPGPWEIATIYQGSEGTQEIAQALAGLIRSTSGAEVEIVLGGQPHYEYIISLE